MLKIMEEMQEATFEELRPMLADFLIDLGGMLKRETFSAESVSRMAECCRRLAKEVNPLGENANPYRGVSPTQRR